MAEAGSRAEVGEPAGYPAELTCDAVLADGGLVHIRPIRPDDGPALVAFHERLSSETVYFRFFNVHPHLSAAEVARFTTVDYRDRLALVALLGDVFVGVARYDRLADTDDAEVAFVVADAHQGRGLGTLLLEHLAAAARHQGVGRFVADTLSSNRQMLRVFTDAGFATEKTFDDGVVRVAFPIASDDRFTAAVDERDFTAERHSIGRLLRPRSVAVVGASARPGGIGHAIVENLIQGGFRGRLYPVNRTGAAVAGVAGVAGVLSLPEDVDVAVIAVPAAQVLGVVADCATRSVRGLVVISAGFAETGAEGARAERRLVELARANGMRLIGPNCLGIVNTDPEVAMSATFAASRPPAGRVGLLSQSGAVGIAVLDWATQVGLGISSFVSVGNKADVSSNDLLAYWESDRATEVIVLYLESFGNPRKFARLARRVAHSKPIVAVKAGRGVAGGRAARSHTAAAANPDRMVDALFAQAGVIRVDTLAELFDTAAVLADQPLPTGPRVAIVGNSGGPGILAADSCEGAGLAVPELAVATQTALRDRLAAGAAVANPVDLLASARGDDYRDVLRAVLADDSVDAVLAIFTPTQVCGADEIAQALADVDRDGGEKPIVACFLGRNQSIGPAATPVGRQVPTFAFPEPAARALAHAANYQQWRTRSAGREPEMTEVDSAAGVRIVDAALAEAGASGGWLDAVTAGQLLAGYHIPVVASIPVSSASQAATAADTVGYPAVVKAASPALVHKTDLGAVKLGLTSATEAAQAYTELAAALGEAMGGAVVQPEVAAGVETIVGVTVDPLFGPLVMFGLGGITTDLLDDRAFRILPVTELDAADMVQSIRAAPLLTGYRGAPPVDVAAIEDIILRVARLADDLPQIAEIDLNPVIAARAGAIAVDAKIRIATTDPGPDPLLRRLR